MQTEEEYIRECSLKRMDKWVKSRTVIPFTSDEAKYHAKKFIEQNGELNLVSLLAKEYLSLYEHYVGPV